MAKAFDRNIVFLDRAKETTSTQGRGSLNLAGAVAGFQPLSGIGWGTGLYGSPQNYSYYSIEEGSQWEVGLGAYYPVGNTWQRTEVLDSSTTGADPKIDLVGYATIFLTLPASKLISASSGGFVGIGVKQPQYELDIAGTGNMSGIRIDAPGASAPFEIKDGSGSNVEIHWSDGTVQNTSPTGAINTVSGMLSPAGSNRAIQFNNNELYGGSNTLAFRNVGYGALILSGTMVSDLAHTGIANIISIGQGAGAGLVGSNQIIVGYNAGIGSGSDSVIIGHNALGASTNTQNAVVIGNEARGATNSTIVGVGDGRRQGGLDSVAIGANALVGSSAYYNVALGSSAGQNASGHYTVNIGYGANAKGLSAVSIGANSSTLIPASTGYNYSVAVGAAAGAVDRAIALGYGAQAIQPSGFVVANGATNSNMILSGMIGEKLNVANAKLGINQNDPEAMIHAVPKNSTNVGLIIQGTAGQNGDLTRWQNQFGSNYIRVTSDGNIILTSGNCTFNNLSSIVANSGSITTNGLMSGNFDELRFVSEGSNRIKIGVGGGNSSGEISDNDSIYIGNFAGSGIQLPSNYNTYVGAQAGAHDSVATQPSGKYQTFIGYYAGNKAIGGNFGSLKGSDFSTYVGHTAGKDASGIKSVAVGASAGQNFEGRDAVHIGADAGANGSGAWQVNIGSSAGGGANYSINIGYGAGILSTGDNTVFIGKKAGWATNGDDNVEIVTDGASPSIIGVNSNKLHIQNVLVGDTSAKKLAIGNVGAADLSPDATLEVKPNANSDIGFIVQGASSQTANLTEWQDSSETVLASVAADGTISASGAITAATGITLQQTTPAVTTDKLYNVGGALYFNGSGVNGAGGGGTSYTAGTGLTLVGTEFNTANTGNFSAITFDNGIANIDNSGNAVFKNLTSQGNLTVSGTLTYINSTTVTIADKQLELASNSGTATGNDASVDDGGIVLKSTGGDKKWTWQNATEAWHSTENMTIATDKHLAAGPTGPLGSRLIGLNPTDRGNLLLGELGPVTVPDNASGWLIMAGANHNGGVITGVKTLDAENLQIFSGDFRHMSVSGTPMTFESVGGEAKLGGLGSLSVLPEGASAPLEIKGASNAYISFPDGTTQSTAGGSAACCDANSGNISVITSGLADITGCGLSCTGTTSNWYINNIYQTGYFYDIDVTNNVIIDNSLNVSGNIYNNNIYTTGYFYDIDVTNNAYFTSIGINQTNITSIVDIRSINITDIDLRIQQITNQTANLFEVVDVNDKQYFTIGASGDVGVSGNISTTGSITSTESITAPTIVWDDGTTQVTSATGDISIVSGLTVTNTTNIATNVTNIAATGATNAAAATTNTTNIATNVTNIAATGATNAANITTVSGLIPTYTASTGLTLIGTQFSTSGTGLFSHIQFGEASSVGSAPIRIGHGVGAGGDYDVAIGPLALNAVTNSTKNVAVGYQAGDQLGDTSNTNVHLGYTAGYRGSGDGNLALGWSAGSYQDGDFNITLGYGAAYGAEGNNNTYIGQAAGYDCEGHGNLDINKGSLGVTSAMDGLTEKLNIYDTIRGDHSSNRIVIGGNLAAGDYTPDATLEVKPKEHTDIGLIVQGDTSHSANLTEWQNSSETVLASVAADGSISGAANLIASTGSMKQLLFDNYIIRIGHDVGNNNGTHGIHIGRYAGQHQGDGAAHCLNVGYGAGYNSDGDYNASFGYQAGYIMSASSDYNLSLGYHAGQQSDGDYNISVGYQAAENSEGDKNIFIGYGAGYGAAGGSHNVEIVASGSVAVNSPMSGLSHKLNIQNIIHGDASTNRIAIGGNLAAADYTPDATLEIKPKEHTDIGLIVQGDTSHSANLTEWQNSAEGIRAYVAADGSIATSGTVSATGGMVIGGSSKLMWVDDDGDDNGVRIGYDAGVMGGLRNISIGQYAGNGAGGGDYNVGIGRYACGGSAGDYNVGVGYMAGNDNDGNYNVGIGYEAGLDIGSTSEYNNNIGYRAGKDQVNNSDHNQSIGYNAGRNADGDYNVFLGVHAGYNSAGSNNIYIGYQAGLEADPGSNNIEILTESVYDVKSTLDGLSNKINIENTIMGDTAANKIVIGSGTTAQTANYSPSATLEIKPKETTDTALIVHSSGIPNVLSVYGSNVSISGRLISPISAPVLQDTNATVNVALTSGNYHEVELAAAVTKIIFKQGMVGQKFIVRFAQPAGANYTIAWTNVDVDEGGTGGTVSWAAGGTAPTMTATNGKADTYGFIQRTATTFDGFVVGQNI